MEYAERYDERNQSYKHSERHLPEMSHEFVPALHEIVSEISGEQYYRTVYHENTPVRQCFFREIPVGNVLQW